MLQLTRQESELLQRFIALSTNERVESMNLEHALLTSLAFALRDTTKGC